MIPAAVIYLWSALTGIVLGAGADLVFDWPWWLVAAGFAAAVALFFLSTSFWPRGQNEQLLRVLSPGRALQRERREEIKRFTNAPFPLYGLPPSWEGPRFLAGWGSVVSSGRHASRSLCLGHGDPTAEDAPLLRVEVDNDPPPDHLRRRMLALGLGEETASRPAASWTTVVIPVDGHPVEFDCLSGPTNWVASTVLGDLGVILHGRRLPVTSVELVTIVDLDRYVDGPRS